MRIKRLSLLCCFIICALGYSKLLFSQINALKVEAPVFNDLGSFHKKISTQVPLAQLYFDQGLVLLYSFEYGESIRSFRAAVKTDPNCAMCYWGLALALGSKTDMPLNGHELEEAKIAIKTAANRVDPSNSSERAFIAALTRRYLNVSPQRLEQISGLCSSYSQVSGDNAKAYANEMYKITLLFPDDTDAKVLYAAALFDVTEWNFWNRNPNTPNPWTLEIINTLESAMKTDKDHPGANHLYVHIIESSPYPERGLASANRLNSLVPGSEHMAHMPCHTYFSLGRYHDATDANQRAISIYQNYARQCRAQGFEPEIQYLFYHNYDYLIYSATMEGRKKTAISASKELKDQSLYLIKNNSFLQKWLTPRILTLARFGEWNEILKLPRPSSEDQYALGIWYYAQGLADLQLNQLHAAKKNLKQLKSIIKQGPIDKSLGSMGYSLLQISSDILEGLLANQSGKTQRMLEKFEDAIKIQDSIGNNDPPSWYFPVRQLLGNALLHIHHFSEAEGIFQQDLKEHPKNGWSLWGLARSLRGLGKNEAAAHIEREYKEAWVYADIPEPVSLFH